MTNNKPNLYFKGGGYHAEERLMSRYKSRLKNIVICRTNNSGDLLPIEPCKKCKSMADKLGVKITVIETVQ